MIILTGVIVLLLTNNFIFHKQNENMKLNTKERIQKLVFETLMILAVIFVFEKFTKVNLLISLLTIMVFSYLTHNSIYMNAIGIRQENFALVSSMVHRNDTPQFYEFDKLYSKEIKTLDDDGFIEVEPASDSPKAPKAHYFNNTPEETLNTKYFNIVEEEEEQKDSFDFNDITDIARDTDIFKYELSSWQRLKNIVSNYVF